MAINKPGVYKITNLINNKLYIGSSIHIKTRFKEHKTALKYNKHYNSYLQLSYNKYNIDNFSFEVLEYCDNLLEKEQYWIDLLKPKYNLQPLAYRTQGTKRSDETKLKMSIVRKGIKFSDYTKNLMRLAKLGKPSLKCKPITQLDINNIIINKYNSITLAAELTKIGRKAICNCLSNLSKSAGGYKWIYTNDK